MLDFDFFFAGGDCFREEGGVGDSFMLGDGGVRGLGDDRRRRRFENPPFKRRPGERNIL